MQVNVTVCINGPSGQELSVAIGPETAWVSMGTEGVEVPLAELRQFVAVLGKVVGNG